MTYLVDRFKQIWLADGFAFNGCIVELVVILILTAILLGCKCAKMQI